MTEELKGSKSPADDLQSGDEVWIRAIIDDPCSDRIYVFAKDGFGARTYISVVQDDIRESPPSEHSEIAELDAAVIEAAECVTNTQVSDLFRVGTDGQIFVETPLGRLFQAVVHRSEALAPPSLEDQVKAILDRWSEKNGEYSDTQSQDVTADILALVKAHESNQA